jgi:biotin transport system substrate-specific component
MPGARRTTGSVSRGAVDPRAITTAGLLAALMCASALLTLRLGPVPFTLQMFVVVLAGLLLAPATAALAMGAYLAAGAAGLPVFSGLTGGLGVLLGPTGGYLWGFLAGAVAGAWVRTRIEGSGARRLSGDVVAAAVVLATTYAFGALQLALVAHLGAASTFAAGVAPFILPDAAKAAVAIGVATAVRRARAGR